MQRLICSILVGKWYIKSPGMLVNLDIGRDKYFLSMPALNPSHFPKVLPCVLFPLKYVQKFSLVSSGDISMYSHIFNGNLEIWSLFTTYTNLSWLFSIVLIIIPNKMCGLKIRYSLLFSVSPSFSFFFTFWYINLHIFEWHPCIGPILILHHSSIARYAS